MSLSPYIRDLRKRIGNDLLVLPSVGAAVYDDQGRILLALHAEHGGWVWPGGACEPDEEPADSLVREVWEETGLWVEPERLLGVCGGPNMRMRYPNGDLVSYVMTVFKCRILGGKLVPDQTEMLDARFVEVGEVARLPLAPWVPPVLPVLLSQNGTAEGFSKPVWRPVLR